MSAADLRPFNEPLFNDLNSLASNEGAGTWTFHTASRLFPWSNWDDAAALSRQSSAVRAAIEATALMIAYNFKPEDIAAANKDLVELLRPWREASPGAGTYMNEADINEPDWQQAFYGDNYG
ncbi:FAD binding domain protein [Diaporthe helianthi]|uniref:FAD binding domain protein n=1 Tax=Diaporthe helianthi TaxID=158607 RepID=A0A2P5ICH5_DIAHE|nr:FAD binding domain protein [Diaporthe helianthi]